MNNTVSHNNDSVTNESPAVYVSTYKKYNEGSLYGAWMCFEDYKDANEFLDACLELHKDEYDPELMFQDFEYIPEALYHECMSIETIQKIYDYTTLSEEERDIVQEYYKLTENTDQEVSNILECFITVLDGVNLKQDLGEYMINMTDELDEDNILSRYFDYEAYGNDLILSGDIDVSDEGYVFWSR
jgi:antirestriction protein